MVGTHTENSKGLWTDFKVDFKNAYTDIADQPHMLQKLHMLHMTGGDLDQYMVEFNQLLITARYTPNEMGTINLYKNGLQAALRKAIIDNYQTKPTTLEGWQQAAQDWQLCWLEKKGSNPTGLTSYE